MSSFSVDYADIMYPREAIKTLVPLVSTVALLSACSKAAVPKAVDTTHDSEATVSVDPAVDTSHDATATIVVRTSQSVVTVENHTGRRLLNIRVTITASDVATPFIMVLPTIEKDATSELPVTSFRSEESTMLDPGLVHPKEVRVTARDTFTRHHDVTVPWTP